MKKVMLEVKIIKNGGVINPSDLESISKKVEGRIDPQSLVIISGRMPVWVYAHLVHLLHPTAGVATFDPRLGGGVVVARHHNLVPSEGTVVPSDGAEKVEVVIE